MSNTSENNTSTCANCGKVEDDSIKLKTCTACKMVKYCSRDCQIAHRSQHKNDCKRRAKELHDEKLFKQPPPMEDCPICMVRIPSLISGRTYMACCGKVICKGCIHAVQLRALLAGRQEEDDVCPFCRAPPPESVNEEMIKRYEKRADMNDPIGIRILGDMYASGQDGLPQNQAKALELWHRAGELGCNVAYYCIGNAYLRGNGVERDMKKTEHYWELAAMGGDPYARNNLGAIEGNLGNFGRALNHFMIAIRGGDIKSLENIKAFYSQGLATKDDYENALQAYEAYVGEIKSNQRDEAAAFHHIKYYDAA